MKEERKKKFRSPKPGKRPNPMKEERKKTKRNPGGEDQTSERRKGKKKKKSKGAAKLWLVGAPCMFNYKNAIELWIMETEKS